VADDTPVRGAGRVRPRSVTLSSARAPVVVTEAALPHVFDHADILFQNRLRLERQVAPIGRNIELIPN